MTDLVERLRARDGWVDDATIFDEAATDIERLRSWGVPDCHRMCVNCGRDLKLTDKRGEDWCRDEYPGQDFYACTGDMTYGELIAEIHRLENKVRAIIAAHPAAIEKAREEEREYCRLREEGGHLFDKMNAEDSGMRHLADLYPHGGSGGTKP